MGRSLGSAIRDAVLDLFAPLLEAASDDGAPILVAMVGHTRELGLDSGLQGELENIASVVEQLAALDEEDLSSWSAIATLLESARAIAASVDAIVDAIDDPALAARAADLASELAEKLLARYLRTRHPTLFRLGAALTVIERAESANPEPMAVEAGIVVRLPWQQDRFHFERVSALLDDLLGTMRAEYLPNDMDAASDAHGGARRLFPLLRELGASVGMGCRYDLLRTVPMTVPPLDPGEDELGLEAPEPGEEDLASPTEPPPDVATYYLEVQPRLILFLPGLDGGVVGPARFAISVTASSAEHPGGVRGYVVAVHGDAAWSETRGNWSVALEAGAQLAAVAVGPGGVTLAPAGGGTGTSATLTVDRIPPSGEPAFRLGAADETRIDLGALRFAARAEASTTRQAVSVELRAANGALVIVPPGNDGLLSALLPAQGAKIPVDVGVIASSDRGLEFVGGVGLGLTWSPHITIGPVAIDTIELALVSEGGNVHFRARSVAAVALGPARLTVQGVGVRLTASMPDAPACLGPFDLDAEFWPPTGAGVKIDSSAVTGGGFIAYDGATGRYSGTLGLKFEDITVIALAILDTRPAEGGWSFVGVISAEFEPIQLGLGFTLNGVGGLIGLNRRIDKQALKAELAAGRLADLFFPGDVVAKANELLTSMGNYFPTAEGRYVFGPAAKLGWLGLVTADLAILIEVPEPVRVVIIGKVDAGLPSADSRLIRIAADVLGFIEFDEQRFELEAMLGPDSKVLDFSIEGGLAVRVDWGERPDFILSIGGFHSGYLPPEGFPTPKRIKIPIGTGNDPRLDLTGFLALTTNTAQVGAKVDFYASAGWGLSIEGDIGFEALFIFSPFSFDAKFWGGVALKRDGDVLAGISIDARLTGPRPYHAWGEACLVIDWAPDICVDFDVTVGDETPVLGSGADALAPLLDAIQEPRNWSEGATAKVIKAAPAAGAQEQLLFEPSATVTMRQSVVPLNRRVEKYGGGLMPGGPVSHDVEDVNVASAPVPHTMAQGFFAPYQFEELTEDERLSREAFEKMDAGVTIDAATAAGESLSRVLEYETKIIENIWGRRAQPEYILGVEQQLAGVRMGAASIAPLRTDGPGRYAPTPGTPPLVALEDEGFVIVTIDTFADSNLIAPMTRGAALIALDEHFAANPTARGLYQVVPAYELTEAA